MREAVNLDLVPALITGSIAGVISAGLWAIGAWILRARFRSRMFGRLAGHYSAAPKFPDQADRGAAHRVTISVTGSTLAAAFKDLSPGDALVGEIGMSATLPRTGAGYYEHRKDQSQRWGFWEVQVKDADTLLVHATYTRRDFSVVTQGFVWSRTTEES